MAEREYDVVVLGATGFTGALTAEYLAGHAPGSTRWAIAGRNQSKLERLGLEVPRLHADVNDPGSLKELAESTRVLITTVGPYIHYGEPVVAACAAAGTDYVDLTGEPEFVDLMWLRYNAQAESTGARIVHSCGFDSIPYDLGVLYTVNQLPEGVPISATGMIRAGVIPSGGTFHSAVHIMGRLRQGAKVARERRAREDKPAGRRVRLAAGRPHRDPDTGWWLAPAPTIDPQTVARSARALERYGPDFTYTHYMASKRLAPLAALGLGAGALVLLAQTAPSRNLVLKLRDPGTGPSPQQREKGRFKLRIVGEGGGKRVVAEVSGGEPGYTETSKMLAESALCLAHDDLPQRSGQLTTAVAMGQPLIDRLTRAGIEFRLVESS